nr:hypothetical protein MACL_00003207 [Theileria orientalis]
MKMSKIRIHSTIRVHSRIRILASLTKKMGGYIYLSKGCEHDLRREPCEASLWSVKQKTRAHSRGR